MASQAFLEKAYLAYFGRPVDPSGAATFANQSEATVLASFSSSAESQALYGATFGASQINAIYNMLFNRDADIGGLNFYLNRVATGASTAAGVAYDIMNGAQNSDVTVINNKIAASRSFTASLDTIAEIIGYQGNGAAAAARSFLQTVTDTAATEASIAAAITSTVANGGAAGATVELLAGADNVPGTTGNDVINGVVSATAANQTLNNLDTIVGGAGSDTLNILDESGAQAVPASLTMSGVETVSVRSAGAATIDLTGAGISGVTKLNSTQSAAATLTAATTTDVTVTGATGAITIDGGNNITVTDSTKDTDITIGATTVGAGNITVTATKAGTTSVAVDGGVNVTLNVSGTSGGADTITVGNGGAATDLPSGVVSVTSAHVGVAATDVTLNAITAKGGSTITVTQTADTAKAAADTTGATLTQGAVTVVAGKTTTAVTVAQAASTTEVVGVAAVAGKTETASVKFGVLKSGDVLKLDSAADLTFTAAADMTAEQVAQVFASLIKGTIPAAGDTQGQASAALGTYTGNGTGWTSAAAVGDTVVFTSTTADSNATDLAFVLTNTSTNSVAPTVTTTAGASKTDAVTGVLGVATGEVLIDDTATATITTVSIDGYGGASKIGNTATLSKLTKLTLANSGSTGTAGETDASMSVDADSITSLDLSVNAIKGTVTLDAAAAASIKTLNLTATGADSSFALTAAAVETLAISGDKKATLDGGTFTALKTLTVSGTASAVFDGDEADTLTSVNTSATTGEVTASIDGTKATYTGGAGVDTVTLVTGTALTKAINLGAGDDTLKLVASTTGSTAAVAGGDGTDTLSMTTATAAALDDAVQTFYTGFERLTINNAAATSTVNLANLGFTNYVTTTGTSGTLTLADLASNGTVVLTTAPTTGVTVQIKDASTGTADVLNLVVSSTGDLAAGLLTAANVETVNVSVVDTETGTQTKNVDSLTLTADKATTVNLTGAQDLTLTMTGSTKVTSIDGSQLTGSLTVTSLNTTTATTIKGGSAADVLTAATGTTADVLNGGAGDDTLTANAGQGTLTGGAGNDLFKITTAQANPNAYSTITDFAAGDLIQLGDAVTFQSAKVTLGDTAVFQDYVNAALTAADASTDSAAAWFQFAGNTYVVIDEATSDSTTFVGSEDLIVKIAGTVDLSTASFNATHFTIGL